MTAKKAPAKRPASKPAMPVGSEQIVAPEPNVAPSSDAAHWKIEDSKEEFPPDQGSQVEQVFDAIPTPKD